MKSNDASVGGSCFLSNNPEVAGQRQNAFIEECYFDDNKATPFEGCEASSLGNITYNDTNLDFTSEGNIAFKGGGDYTIFSSLLQNGSVTADNGIIYLQWDLNGERKIDNTFTFSSSRMDGGIAGETGGLMAFTFVSDLSHSEFLSSGTNGNRKLKTRRKNRA